MGEAIYKAPVAGDYSWGPTDQVIEPEDGAPAHLFLGSERFCNKQGIIQICN